MATTDFNMHTNVFCTISIIFVHLLHISLVFQPLLKPNEEKSQRNSAFSKLFLLIAQYCMLVIFLSPLSAGWELSDQYRISIQQNNEELSHVAQEGKAVLSYNGLLMDVAQN